MRKTSKGADVMNAISRLKEDIESHVRSSKDEVAKEVAENIYEKSQEYVPQDTGDLKNSGRVVKNSEGDYTVEYTDWKSFLLEFNIPENQPHDQRHGPADFGLPGNKKGYTTPGTGALYLTRATDEEANRNKMVGYLRDSMGRFKKRRTY